jgi:hypothetical protein
MGRRETIDYLHSCATAEVFSHEHACLALRRPPLGLDERLMKKLYRRLLARNSTVIELLHRLPEEHSHIVERLLEKPRGPASVFAVAFSRHAAQPGPALREAGAFLRRLYRFEWRPGVRKPGRMTIAALVADARAVRGSQEVVATAGFKEPRHIAVLAADGSDDSADILLPLASEALRRRGQRLVRLLDWLVPFSHGRTNEIARRLEDRGGRAQRAVTESR